MISVITITQYKRRYALQLLYKCILDQIQRPDEWVITEGSQSKEDADQNEILINDFIKLSEIPIVYVPYQGETKLGGLRNRGNNSCSGDIIVCMDDDDFYPNTRIQHVVDRFSEYPNVNLAGCTNILIYDYGLKQFYQCKGYNPYHSTNNAMAWRKSYTSTHQHDESKRFGEESSFTNQFSEPMVQLLPIHTVIVSSHSENTFDKKEVLKNKTWFTLLQYELLVQLMTHDTIESYSKLFYI